MPDMVSTSGVCHPTKSRQKYDSNTALVSTNSERMLVLQYGWNYTYHGVTKFLRERPVPHGNKLPNSKAKLTWLGITLETKGWKKTEINSEGSFWHERRLHLNRCLGSMCVCVLESSDKTYVSHCVQSSYKKRKISIFDINIYQLCMRGYLEEIYRGLKFKMDHAKIS